VVSLQAKSIFFVFFSFASLAPKLFLANSLCVLLLFVLFSSLSLSIPFLASGRCRLFSSRIFFSSRKNFQFLAFPTPAKVSDSLFRGAQPHLESLDELQKLGVTTIECRAIPLSGALTLAKLRRFATKIDILSTPPDRLHSDRTPKSALGN
jgi:hypothetical protein